LAKWNKIALLLPLFWTSLLPARDKAETWIQVTSPHFVVATNAGEKQARRVADQFERMRSVFHVLFPKLQIDPASPIVVLAIRDEANFRALEPAASLAKGQLKLGGLFLRAPEKNYVLMRLDAEGDHPYAVVYHEYTHLILSKAAEWLPLWLNEGLAEFYQNTEIHETYVELGQPSLENLFVLRAHKLLPLATLFAVDRNSPYYHEENKGSIFYAESWALVHYLRQKDQQDNTLRLNHYIDLLADKTEPLTAANAAFGDLNELEKALEGYVQQAAFHYIRGMIPTGVDDSAFKAQVLTSPQADALRADFLAYNHREQDARTLLDRVLNEDPNNVSAHETMGFLAFQQRHIDEAKKWYGQAVQLDSRSYLAYYYFSAIAMQGAMTPAEEAQVEASLQRATELNPSFAPTFDRLAVFWGMRHKNLEQARMAGLTAITLDPGNVGYRVNEANVLMAMEQGDRAVEVLTAAAKLAKTPQEVEWVDHALTQARDYAAVQQRAVEEERRLDAQKTASSPPSSEGTDAAVPRLAHRDFVPPGPHRFLTGVLRDVHCDASHLELALHVGTKTLALHSDDYYKIHFSVLGFKPGGELKPCTDLEGKPAKVEYVVSADKSETPHLVSIELQQ
jgi:tetratricopeptide (TPR) repeat protein